MTRPVHRRARLLACLAALAVSAGPVRAQGTTPFAPPSPEAPATPEAPAAPGAAEAPAAASPPAAFVETLPQTLEGVPGTWDLSRDGSTRRCVMTLTAQSSDSGRRLSFPAGCRRALPILNEVAAWLFVDGAIRLVDRNVRPVLLFKTRDDRRSLMASTEKGEVYSLVPLQIAAMAPPVPPGAEGREPSFQLSRETSPGTIPPGTTPPSPEAPAAGERPLAGTYALDRYREQDVCRLELKPAEGGPAPVRILDGCRDSGLTTFDPVSWQGTPGRLTLVARRGHSVALVPAGENHWRREPEIGTTFVLRRIEAAPSAGSP